MTTVQKTEPKVVRSRDFDVRADFSQAAHPIRFRYHSDPADEWRSTPYQVADAGHLESAAVRLVREWIKTL